MRAERLTARITGHVQGVGYRWWACRQAVALSLTGWVMNANEERAVDLVAEGDAAGLDELERRLYIGPPGARVQAVKADRGPASAEFEKFGIMRS